MLAVNDNEAVSRAGQSHASDGSREREDLLTSVAHDLRTPLSTILVSAAILADEHGESGEVQIIRRAVARASRLIEDLLLANALEAGALPLQRQRCSIASLFAEIARDHEPLARERNIELSVGPSGALEIDVDRQRVVQMLSNLVGNALKFTPSGGRVSVRAVGRASAIVFVVSDTGFGIEPADLPHIFERFWRAPATRARAPGTGLGLAIVKGVVDAHAGAITIESRVGRGTRVMVSMPSGRRRLDSAHATRKCELVADSGRGPAYARTPHAGTGG